MIEVLVQLLPVLLPIIKSLIDKPKPEREKFASAYIDACHEAGDSLSKFTGMCVECLAKQDPDAISLVASQLEVANEAAQAFAAERRAAKMENKAI